MSSSSSELLQLTWNSYVSNYHSAFSEIRENDKFYDVTIATHDGHALAHRVILSSCSPILARILDLNRHPQPLIYILGIPIQHINTILDFMYKGEANVSHDTIDEFLVSAEELKVKGLTKDKSGDEDHHLESGSQNFDAEGDRDVGHNCKEDKNKAKENKRKSELDKNIESVIDSVLKQTVSEEISPKVRKVSPELHGKHFLEDSDGAPTMNSFQEYDHFLLQSENPPSAGCDEIETEYDRDEDQKLLILTKSDEDKARFRAIVASMITNSASNHGGLDCLVCGKQFSGMNPKTSVTSHVDHLHTDHLLHKCHVCGVIKNTSVGLTKHLKLHKRDKILGVF